MDPKSKTKSNSKTTKPQRKSVIKSDSDIEIAQESNSTQNFTNKLNSKNKKLAVLIIAGIFLIVAGVLIGRNTLLAAMVNGKLITRLEVIRALEKTNGEATLEAIITKTLIEQEAQKQGMMPSQDEVNKEIETISKNIKAQGTTLDEALAAQGMSREQLEEEISIQLALRKMTAKDIKYTNKEVDDLISQNTESIPEGVTEEEFRQQAKAQLEQQKQQEASEKLITKLRDQAKISKYLNY